MWAGERGGIRIEEMLKKKSCSFGRKYTEGLQSTQATQVQMEKRFERTSFECHREKKTKQLNSEREGKK